MESRQYYQILGDYLSDESKGSQDQPGNRDLIFDGFEQPICREGELHTSGAEDLARAEASYQGISEDDIPRRIKLDTARATELEPQIAVWERWTFRTNS